MRVREGYVVPLRVDQHKLVEIDELVGGDLHAPDQRGYLRARTAEQRRVVDPELGHAGGVELAEQSLAVAFSPAGVLGRRLGHRRARREHRHRE